MKRSAQPLPSGERTKAGELSIPGKAIPSGSGLTCTASRDRDASPGCGAAPAHPAEVAAHTLTDRLQRLEARRAGSGMNADTGGGAMIDRDKHGGGPVLGPGGVQIGAPHSVDGLRNDGAVMRPGSARRSNPAR